MFIKYFNRHFAIFMEITTSRVMTWLRVFFTWRCCTPVLVRDIEEEDGGVRDVGQFHRDLNVSISQTIFFCRLFQKARPFYFYGRLFVLSKRWSFLELKKRLMNKAPGRRRRGTAIGNGSILRHVSPGSRWSRFPWQSPWQWGMRLKVELMIIT